MLAKTYLLMLLIDVALLSSPTGAAKTPCRDFSKGSFSGGVNSKTSCRTA